MNFSTFLIYKKQSYRILLITLALLMLPLIAMQLTPEVSWQIGDFVVAGILLVGFGYCYELLVKLLPGKRRQVFIAVTLLLLLILIWSILAVDLI
jgi:hypothetical protein